VSAGATVGPADERVWLQRAVFVLVRPGEVLEGLRDDSDSAARARSEAVLALVLLGGIASVLWTPVAGRLMDVKGPHAEDGLEVAIWAFLAGSLSGASIYFVGGLVLYGLTRVRGGVTYRQARHLLAFAAAPIALSLFVIWPVRLAVYGEDLFRSGGSDHGAGNAAFVVLELLFVGWSLALLVVGLRALMRRQPRRERL
jgi:Yip1-like protein